MKQSNYKTIYKDPEIINFIEYFLNSAFVNMDIEDEAVFSEDELYQRYRIVIDNLIKHWVYKWLKYKNTHVKN